MISQGLVDIIGNVEPDDAGGSLGSGVFWGIFRLSWSGVWKTKVRNSPGGANDYSGFLGT